MHLRCSRYLYVAPISQRYVNFFLILQYLSKNQIFRIVRIWAIWWISTQFEKCGKPNWLRITALVCARSAQFNILQTIALDSIPGVVVTFIAIIDAAIFRHRTHIFLSPCIQSTSATDNVRCIAQMHQPFVTH